MVEKIKQRGTQSGSPESPCYKVGHLLGHLEARATDLGLGLRVWLHWREIEGIEEIKDPLGLRIYDNFTETEGEVNRYMNEFISVR